MVPTLSCKCLRARQLKASLSAPSKNLLGWVSYTGLRLDLSSIDGFGSTQQKSKAQQPIYPTDRDPEQFSSVQNSSVQFSSVRVAFLLKVISLTITPFYQPGGLTTSKAEEELFEGLLTCTVQ
jgi:hypothetical protein